MPHPGHQARRATVLTMARPALKLSAVNSPDPSVVADAAVALILDFHAKTSCETDIEKMPPAEGAHEPDPDGAKV